MKIHKVKVASIDGLEIYRIVDFKTFNDAVDFIRDASTRDYNGIYCFIYLKE